MPQVVDRELPLHAVGQLQLGQGHNPGVGDQTIQRDIKRSYFLGTGHHRGPVSQVKKHRNRVAVDRGAGGVRLGLGTRDTDYPGAAQRQHAHGLEAESRVAAGNGKGHTTEINASGYFLGGGAIVETTGRRGLADNVSQDSPGQDAENTHGAHML